MQAVCCTSAMGVKGVSLVRRSPGELASAIEALTDVFWALCGRASCVDACKDALTICMTRRSMRGRVQQEDLY